MDRVFQCPQCDKGFKEVRTLRLHLKIHNAEYPEQCNVCQKVFRTKWQLKQHQVLAGFRSDMMSYQKLSRFAFMGLRPGPWTFFNFLSIS